MTGFLISAMIVIVLVIGIGVIGIWLANKAVDGNWNATVALCFLRNVTVVLCFLIFLLLGLVINYTTKTEATGPCHEYKTEMMYNDATKTFMPYRVCVLRGE